MTTDRPYYEAYEERYRRAHAAGVRWMGDAPSGIVAETIERYSITADDPILELGCGEGRDAAPLLSAGFQVLATDISPEAIRYCRALFPQFAGRFRILDCLHGALDERFSFIYAIALLHMFVPDEDRRAFYRFIREHLRPGGLALIGSMGDGGKGEQKQRLPRL